MKGESEERQRASWVPLWEIVKRVKYVKAGENEERETDKIFDQDWDRGESYVCKEIKEGIAYIYLADFDDEEKIQKLYNDNEELLNRATGLIIDVRGNGGGMDSAFFPLFKYCISNGMTLKQASKPEYSPMDKGMETIFTERNYKKRITMLEEYLCMDIPEESKKLITGVVDSLKANMGKGFVEDEESDSDNFSFVGDSKVEKVIIMTDEDCGSSGDSFVYNFSLLPKVTVIGRPTMGILDYSNIIFNDYDEYSFIYPTSRLIALDTDPGMMRHGVPVDVYIPWTPEQLDTDVTLEKALSMF